MLKIIQKYGALLFLINAILIEYTFNLSSIHEWISYILCGYGVLFIMVYPKQIFSSTTFQNFKVIFYVLLINSIYLITFGIETINEANIFYYLAKFGSLILIVFSIMKNPVYFNGKFLNSYISFIAALFIFGILIRNVDMDSGRLAFGFNNSNLAGMLASSCFGIAILSQKIISKKHILFALFFIIIVLLTGSRTSFLIVVLALVFKYKFKIYYYLLGLVLIISINIFFNIGGSNNALDRLLETTINSEGKISTGREIEYDFALVRLKAKLLTGNGFMSYKNFDANEYHYFSEREPYGSHNAYLTIGIMYGVFFGGILIFVILKTAFRGVKKYYVYDSKFTVHVFIVIAVLLTAMTEDLIVGINQVISYLFFISVSIVGVGLRSVDLKKIKTLKN